VRRDRLVASVVLTAALAMVAVPGPAGSRSPGGDSTVAHESFQPVLLDASYVPGMVSEDEDDRALRSASAVEPDQELREPAPESAVPTRPLIDQPESKAGSAAKNTWHLDRRMSWYGPGFYGNRTACGYKLTTSLIGVAHRTLPCGTKILFRNPANGRTLVVPVVDRGPYVSGRIFDLTGGACKALGHCYTGPMYWKYASR
jgi:rare lipoprotein A (peptidoglycan hydrolase)